MARPTQLHLAFVNAVQLIISLIVKCTHPVSTLSLSPYCCFPLSSRCRCFSITQTLCYESAATFKYPFSSCPISVTFDDDHCNMFLLCIYNALVTVSDLKIPVKIRVSHLYLYPYSSVSTSRPLFTPEKRLGCRAA